MKVVVLNGEFMKSLEMGKVLVDPKVFPIFQTVTFHLERGWGNEFFLVFRVWNNKDWLEGRVGCFVKFEEGEDEKVWKKWTVTVNYLQLMKVLKEFSKKQTLILEKVDTDLGISDNSGDNNGILILLELQDDLLFDKPSFRGEGDKNFTSEFKLIVDNLDLVKAIKYVEFVRTSGKEKYNSDCNYIQKYYLDTSDNESVYLVATDNHRLSCYKLKVTEKSGALKSGGVLLAKEQSLLLKSISEATLNLLDIRVAEIEENGEVLVTFLALPFVYKGINSIERFPAWRDIAPEEFPRSMVIEEKVVKDMVDFIKKGEKFVKAMSKEKKRRDSFADRVHFVFQEGVDQVKVEIWSIVNSEIPGKRVLEKEFPCKWSGDNFLIAFSMTYILEVLSVIQGGLKMQFTEATGITQIEDLKDPNFIHWLMPIDLAKITS